MSAIEKLGRRRILFLNWRDLSNPAAGGAETYTEEIARRFADAGARLTLFTSKYQGAEPYDWANRYLVVRQGGRFGVYLAAARYLKKHGQHYDAIVDFQNGIPFFSPLWSRPKVAVVCIIHHVHQKQFDMYFRWPFNHFARLLEGRVSRYVYRRRPLVAVSPSTRAEMHHQLGLHGQTYIIPNGIDLPLSSRVARSTSPTIAVVTRHVPQKRLHLIVEAIPDLLRRWPDLRVHIAGTGPTRETLISRVRELGLEQVIILPGRISEQTKTDLLGGAWLTIAPSLAEGWGLTVLEANAVGTPAVAFDVPGLRDSVRDEVTGWLVPSGQNLGPALARALEELSDPERQRTISQACLRWAHRFSWDACADRLASVLLSEIARRELDSPSRRSPVQLATVAWWPPDEGNEIAELIRKTLRVTDVVRCTSDGLWALLLGCDELGAITALQRVPLRPAQLRLATTTDLLCAASEEIPW